MNTKKAAFKAAFPHTLPICAGFLFLGASYGLLMTSKGFSPAYPILMSMFIFAGSMEFVTVNLLLSSFNPLYAFFLTLVVNARHLFYGISMLDKFKGTGIKKLYLIFGMCDESFSINSTVKIPEGIDKGEFMLFVTLLNHLYWFLGSTIGGIFGSYIKFNLDGIEFVVTAMFIVIFLENWLKEKQHISSVIGIIISLICLFLFGSHTFVIPSMVMILIALTCFKKPIDKGGISS